MKTYRPEHLRPDAYGEWARPVEPDPANAERWARYCAQIEDRIRQVRAEEGHEPWRTFGTDMSDFGEPLLLPVGPVTMPTNRVPAWERRLAS